MGLESLELIYEEKTKFQTMRFYNNTKGELLFTLNTFIQFVEGEDERIYHEVITKPAFDINPTAKDILILGGGDGLVARNVKRLNPEANITLVELDENVISLFSTDERLLSLNEGSLLNNINIVIDNAMNWVEKNQDKKFDIIICDFPDPNDHKLEKLYEEEFLRKVCNLLNKKGIIVIQCHYNIVDKELIVINNILGNYKEIDYKMPYLMGGVILLGEKRD